MNPRVLLTLLAVAVTAATPAAETHRFTPKVFHTTFSSEHAPVLRIRSGDRVITSTADDAGAHAQTGPFYIEGAEPGDLLVVTIEKLVPNRPTGTSTSFVIPGAVDPGAFTSKPDPAPVTWAIDTAKGIVRFDLEKAMPQTDWRSRFSSPAFELPLRPTLGSIAVAPATDHASASSPWGPFGGHLLSTGLAAGSKVMLPVSQAGALLFLGRGRARQGDGGIGGTGIETSLDVEFSVEVVKKKEWPHSSVVRPSTVVGEFPQGWPRVENADYLMTVAGGSSLLEATQHATTELHHWLDDAFGLSEKAVNVFMGQAIEFEIANVAGPDYTVTARVRKSYLPRPTVAP